MAAATMATLHATLWAHCLAAARQIAEESSTASGTASSTTSGLQGCGAPLIDLLRRQATQILLLNKEAGQKGTPLIARRLDDLVELAHARFYAYAPSDVPACWRHLYTDASILLFALRWWHHRQSDRMRLSDSDLDGLVRPLDLALILAGGAGPPSRGRAWINEALDLLHCILEEPEEEGKEDDDDPPQRKRPRLEVDDGLLKRHPTVPDFSAGPMFNDKNTGDTVFIPPVCHPVPRSGPLGLEAFQAYLDRDRGTSHQPLVLSGMLDHWPARQPGARPWSSPAYLRWRTLRGRRLVPVEVGRSYVDAGWTQAVVPFGEVLAALGPSEPSEGGLQKDEKPAGPMYLAQHALFAQMPWLQNDISIPDACYTTTQGGGDSDSDSDSGDVLLNAWLGPPGTITPLHTDPHHNLLAQVVGTKYVRLYAPAHTAALRPRGCEAGGVDMGNTSRVDVGAMEGWDDVGDEEDEGDEVDDDEKLRFRAVPYVDCILAPGDTLYIPQGWWHYVRGLSVSFSVSFWWN